MKLILLSGGSGKRLWPLSNDGRSKQFLKVLKDKEGNLESMIQRVWNQLKEVDLVKDTYIATGKAQVDTIYSQLGQYVPLIIEPDRRDTFPAIALSTSFLVSEENFDENEIVIVLPVDPFVQTDYFEQMKKLEQILTESGADIALMGVKPTYPSTKYGYIVPKTIDNAKDHFEVDYFTEKPTVDKAEQLINSNAYWNCGVFAFRLGYLINILLERNIEPTFKNLEKNYHLLNKNSFDYEVIEKAERVVALPYNGEWRDLGTWNTLTEEIDEHVLGKGKLSSDSKNTHILNELDIPIFVLGVNNAVIAASPDGILVSAKEESHRLKEMLTDFSQRPMYEERRWGWYRVLDFSREETGEEVLTKRICIKEGKNLSYQLHHKRQEVWTIVSGTGEFILNDEIRIVKPGDVLEIPVEAKHGIKGITDVEFIEVQMGAPLIEEDIIRLSMDWEKVKGNCINVKR